LAVNFLAQFRSDWVQPPPEFVFKKAGGIREAAHGRSSVRFSIDSRILRAGGAVVGLLGEICHAPRMRGVYAH
jgi:hypothetical protein